MTTELATNGKVCIVCEALKPVDAFPKNQDRCKRCRSRGWFPPDFLEPTPELPARPRWGSPPWRYPMTVHQQRLIREAQAGRCAICRQPAERLFVDHDHTSGWVRGLLCHHCNGGLGFFRDDEEVLRKAIMYLKRAAYATKKD